MPPVAFGVKIGNTRVLKARAVHARQMNLECCINFPYFCPGKMKRQKGNGLRSLLLSTTAIYGYYSSNCSNQQHGERFTS